MKRSIILTLIAFGLSIGYDVHAQCNNTLIDSCKKDIGNSTYLKHFKIRFAKAKKKGKQSTANFSVYLSKGSIYQINTRNDTLQDGKAIVKLYDDFRYYAGNVNEKTKEISNAFAFACQKTGVYYLTIRFHEGKKGCAAVMLSLKEKEKSKYSWD